MPPFRTFCMITIISLLACSHAQRSRSITYDPRSSYPSSEQSPPSCSGTCAPTPGDEHLLPGSRDPAPPISTNASVELISIRFAGGHLSDTAGKLVMEPFPTVLVAATGDFGGDGVPVNAMRGPGGGCCQRWLAS